MKACLIFPRTTVFEDPMVMPPLGLFYLRAVLEAAGHTTTFLDMSEYDDKRKDLYPTVESLPLDHDFYFVSGTSPQAREIRRIGRYLKEQGKVVIGGGPHVTNYAGSVTKFSLATTPIDPELSANFHVLVKGEGETAILEAIERLDPERYGVIVQHANIEDLGSIPLPDRRAAMKYHYFLDGDAGDRRRGTTVFSSRGCPEECRFCDSPILWGRKVRYTPLFRLQEEFEQIQSLGFGAIHFFDDILPLHRARTLQIALMLQQLEFIWRCFFRVDIISKYGKDFLRSLYACGLREALVGVESGSQVMLDGIKKRTTVEQNTVVRQWCREVGIRFKASVILGLPGESHDSMEATKRWVFENRPDKVNLCLFIPFTGTPIAKHRGEYDISWNMDAAALEEHFYAGGWNTLQALVSTSKVSSAQIEDFYHGFIADLEQAGISY